MSFSQINEFILAIIMGAVQGITEFLPISSTAHLRLVTAFLSNGRDIGLATSNIIQFGTLIAILQYFRKDLKEYYLRIRLIILDLTVRDEFVKNFKAWWSYTTPETTIKTKNPEIAPEPEISNQTDLVLAQLLVGTVPIIIFGSLLKNLAESSRGLVEIALFLLAGSALMYTAELIHKKAEDKQKPKIMTRGEVLLVGLFQCLAAFPGISRSGATISGALMLGRKRPESVKFSFLLSIPSLGLLSISDLIKTALEFRNNGATLLPAISNWSATTINFSLASLLISFVLAYLIGLAVLNWLLKYLSQHTFRNFIIYRVLLAVVIVVLVSLNILV